jgi:hypothetical protein
MKQGYRAIEIALRRFVARGGEVNLSQLLAFLKLMLLRHSMRRNERQQDGRDEFFPVQWRLRPGIPAADSTTPNHNESNDRWSCLGRPA